MKKQYLLLLCLLAGAFNNAIAQEELSEQQQFTRKLIKNIHFPRDLTMACNASFVTAIYTIKAGKVVDPVLFSDNTPLSMREELFKQKRTVEATNWALVFKKTGKEFNILLPVYYYSVDICAEKINHLSFAETIQESLSQTTSFKSPLFILPPLPIEFSLSSR